MVARASSSMDVPPLQPTAAGKCSLCEDALSETGDHQAANLKCGHFFGFRCIESHLKKAKMCPVPQCKKRAGPKDVTRLFLSSLEGLSGAGEGELQRQVDAQRATKRKLQEEAEEDARVTEDLRKKCKTQMESWQATLALLPPRVIPRPHHFHMAAIRPFTAVGVPVARFLPNANVPTALVANVDGDTSCVGLAVVDLTVASHAARRLPCIPRYTTSPRIFDLRPLNSSAVVLALSDGSLANLDLRTAGDGLRFPTPSHAPCRLALRPGASHLVYAGTLGGAVLLYDLRNPHTPLATKAPVMLDHGGRPLPVVNLEYCVLTSDPTPAATAAGAAPPAVKKEEASEDATEPCGEPRLCNGQCVKVEDAHISLQFPTPFDRSIIEILDDDEEDPPADSQEPSQQRPNGPATSSAAAAPSPGLLMATPAGVVGWWGRDPDPSSGDPFDFPLWQPASLLPRIAGLRHMTFDPKTSRLASCGDDGGHVWRIGRPTGGGGGVVSQWLGAPDVIAPTAACAFTAATDGCSTGDDVIETTAFVAFANEWSVSIFDTDAGTLHALPLPFDGAAVRWMATDRHGHDDLLLLSTHRGVALHVYRGLENNVFGYVSD